MERQRPIRDMLPPILIANGENSVLVDTGRQVFGKKIIHQIKGHGIQPGYIKLIILTHTHFDHSGNAQYLKEKTGAEIVVHASEKTCLENGYSVIVGTRYSIFQYYFHLN